MYCSQCGFRVDGGTFCGQCGSVNNNRNDSPLPHPEPPVHPPKKSKNGKWLILGIPLVAIAGIIIVLFSLNIIGGSTSRYEPLIIGEWIHTEDQGFVILDFKEDGSLTTMEYVPTGDDSDWLPLEERILLAEEAKEVSSWETRRDDSLSLSEDDPLEFATRPDRVRGGQWYIADDVLVIEGQQFIRNEEVDLSYHEILGTWREIEFIFHDEESFEFELDWDEEKITYTFYADGTYTLYIISPFIDEGLTTGNFSIWANQLTFYNRRSDDRPNIREEAIATFKIERGRLIVIYHPHEDDLDFPFTSINVRY